jgi:4-amino-4-deoxy-L-arabinose transferase-like glycosyltransferase
MKAWTKIRISDKYILVTILLISLILRVFAAIYLGDKVEVLPGTYDQLSYHKLAIRVISGHGFTFGQDWWPLTSAGSPTAHWSYLYTFYLVIVYALVGPHPLTARLIQALIVGLLQPLLAYLIARRVFGQLVALAAAALTAVYIYFIYYTATLMTESFYITAILGALYLAILMVDQAADPDLPGARNSTIALAILLGITLGIAILLRQLFLLFIPFLFLWIWWAIRKRGGRWAIPTLLISGFMIIGMILPFTVDNYDRFGRFVLLNTNAGYAFFWANHPVYGTHFIPAREMEDYQALIPPELRHLDEAALDQALLKIGLTYVLDDPLRYILLSISRIPEYFRFWPSPESGLISNFSRVASFGIMLPFMLLGLGFWLLDHLRDGLKELLCFPDTLLISFVVIYTGIHLLSWVQVRYRLPVDAVLVIFAAFALSELGKRFVVRANLRRKLGHESSLQNES